jgi:hypothetical protein
MNVFHVTNGIGRVEINWMHDYHKVWLWDGGVKTKNPKFDHISAYLLDLKSNANRNFESAAAFFGKQLSAYMKASLHIEGSLSACIVPSSKAGQYSPGLIKILKALERDDRRILAAPGIINRTTPIAKLASGGDRSLYVHRQSLALTERMKPDRTYILLDDITTTGNSLAACCELLHQSGARRVVTFALGKTHD